MGNIPQGIIDENIKAVEEGKPLTLPLRILNGQLKKKFESKDNKDRKKYAKRYREANRDKLKKQKKEWSLKNKGKKDIKKLSNEKKREET